MHLPESRPTRTAAPLSSLLFAIVVGALAMVAPRRVGAEVFYQVDFENGTTGATVGRTSVETVGGTIDTIANPDPDAVNSSALVGRFQVPQSSNSVRAELSSQRLPTDGKTYRYRWSYYVPTEFFNDATLDWFVTSQWKTWPCEVCDPVYDPAICGDCAGIFNEIRVIDQQSWDFRWRAEPDCHDHEESVDFGNWVRFEMLVYWTTTSEGYVRLLRDGVLIRSLDNIRTLFTSFESGTCDLYWALGIYAAWSGNKENLELYVDDIEISDDTSLPPDAGPTDGGGADGGLVDDGGADGCGCRSRGPADSSLLLFVVMIVVAWRRRHC